MVLPLSAFRISCLASLISCSSSACSAMMPTALHIIPPAGTPYSASAVTPFPSCSSRSLSYCCSRAPPPVRYCFIMAGQLPSHQAHECPQPCQVGRQHSLAVRSAGVPPRLTFELLPQQALALGADTGNHPGPGVLGQPSTVACVGVLQRMCFGARPQARGPFARHSSHRGPAYQRLPGKPSL